MGHFNQLHKRYLKPCDRENHEGEYYHYNQRNDDVVFIYCKWR